MIVAETPQFFDGVDLDDPDAVQAASDAASAWADTESAAHLAELSPMRQEEVLRSAAPLDEPFEGVDAPPGE